MTTFLHFPINSKNLAYFWPIFLIYGVIFFKNPAAMKISRQMDGEKDRIYYGSTLLKSIDKLARHKLQCFRYRS